MAWRLRENVLKCRGFQRVETTMDDKGGWAMARIAWSAAIFAALFVILWGCAGPDNAARKSIFEGRRFLETGDYEPARQDFIKAAQVEPSAEAYAFAATASYKMNDLEDARRFINEAQKRDGKSDSSLRILAYKALVLFKEGRREEGLDALHAYHDRYKSYYPLENYEQVERVLSTGQVDLVRLERLLDGDVRRYESDIAQWYGEGTGYFAERYGRPFVNMVPSR
jgi:tetratricopeptide (TPR) repeat protein